MLYLGFPFSIEFLFAENLDFGCSRLGMQVTVSHGWGHYYWGGGGGGGVIQLTQPDNFCIVQLFLNQRERERVHTHTLARGRGGGGHRTHTAG